MKEFINLTKRNIKVYFTDKTMFLTSLITPIILLVLYATFLSNVYHDSFVSNIPEQINVSSSIINGLVSAQLIASLLAVSCITVAFSSNLLMVQDKVNGTIKDIDVSPIGKFKVGLSYFVASLISTLIVNLSAFCVCLIYTYTQGWFYNVWDIVRLVFDVILLTLFGSALSSIINYNLSSQGQISAVSAIVSAGYGFICGAYMPISTFGKTLQNILSFLPSTYGTALVKNHALVPVINQMNVPNEVVDLLKTNTDCNISFLGNNVSVNMIYVVMIISILVLVGVYILLNILKKKRA